MNKNEKLNRLFNAWGIDDALILDGIINEPKYDQAKAKGLGILFIAKEANTKSGTGWDFRDWWNEELKYRFSHAIAEWSSGILNKFPDFNLAKDLKMDAIQSIAFMNINKKTGGGGSADRDKIIAETISFKDKLVEEIKIIDPDIIIGCGLYGTIYDILMPDVEWEKSGYDISVGRWNNTKVVRFYHPSNRYPKAMNYCLLEKVMTSHKFESL